jgi:hypothetical protein
VSDNIEFKVKEKGKMTKTRKGLFIVNILIFIALAFFAYIKFVKTKVLFDCDYGKQPVELLKIVDEKFSRIKGKDTKAIFVFNDLPTMTTLGNVDKLYRLYKDTVLFNVILTKKFKSDYDFQFPYKILSRYKFSCNRMDDGFNKDYFLFVQGRNVVHSDNSFDFFDMNFIFQKKINPGINAVKAQLQAEELKTKIIERLNKKYIELLDVNTESLKRFEDFSGFPKIYFFHANCSGCQLKTMIKRIKLDRLLKEENSIIIFSIFANRFELKFLLDQDNINLPIYIDIADEFLLASRITDDKDNPVVLTQEDLRRL